MKSYPRNPIHILALLVLCLQVPAAFAQPVVSQSVFAVAGLSASSDQLAISSTLGETFIYGGQQQDLFGCQGFQSGTELITTSVIEIGKLKLNLRYFPNPTSSGVSIEWEEPGEYALEIRDALGHPVTRETIQTAVKEFNFDFHGQAPGIYGIFIQAQHRHPVFAGLVVYQTN